MLPSVAGGRQRAQHQTAEVAYAADTHLHADFLSSVRDLSAGGARVRTSKRPASGRSRTRGCVQLHGSPRALVK